VLNIRLVDDNFKSKFERQEMELQGADNLRLIHNGNDISIVKLGTIFPMDVDKKEFFVALKGDNGYAFIDKVEPQDVNLIVKKPIKFNKFNVEYIGRELLGRALRGGGGKLKLETWFKILLRNFFLLTFWDIFFPRKNSRTNRAKRLGKFLLPFLKGALRLRRPGFNGGGTNFQEVIGKNPLVGSLYLGLNLGPLLTNISLDKRGRESQFIYGINYWGC